MNEVLHLREREKELKELLKLLEEKIDIEHIKRVDERYKSSLQYKDVDRPPLVILPKFGETLELPGPWKNFRKYRYSEAFENPVAMLQNMLLSRVVPGVILKDDNPLAIRNDHGTIQIASILGGEWTMWQDSYPWICHFETLEKIKKMVKYFYQDETDINQKGILNKSYKTLKFYNDILLKYPKCREAIQISLPDLQGPMDTAEQLWGSEIFYAFYENPELLDRLLAIIVEALLLVEKEYRKYTYERLFPEFSTQHGYVIPGRILIRNDSSIMVSPEIYSKHIRCHDEKVLKELGGGSIHFCGNGQHLVIKMLEIPTIRGLDFGESNYMNISYIYKVCSQRKVALTNLNPTKEDIISGKAVKEFPTGVVFVYHTTNFDDALEVVKAYNSN